MSHIVKIDCKVTDLSALKRACKQLGLEFCDGQSSWRWFGRIVGKYDANDAAYRHGIKPEEFGKNASHVIKVPGAKHDVALYFRDGQYKLVYDDWSCGGIEKVCGPGLKRLQEEYTAAVATKRLQRQGFRVTRKSTVDGLRLVARR